MNHGVRQEQPPIRVVAISGSSRKASYNTALLREARELAPPAMTLQMYDITGIPPYNDDVRLEGYPPAAADFRSAISTCDAILIASPEYNRSVPGMLKNAIDWASRQPGQPFQGKPMAIMGVSNGALGAAFANYHLRQIMVYLDARLVNGPEVMIGGGKMKFDAQGRLVDQATRDFVAAHLRRLERLVQETRLLAARMTAA